MTYALLGAGFLLVALLAFALALAITPDRRAVVARWAAPVAISAVVLVALTIVFDNLMIAAGLMRYAPPGTSGPTIGLMPAWDLAYPIAGLILLPSLWLLFRRRGDG